MSGSIRRTAGKSHRPEGADGADHRDDLEAKALYDIMRKRDRAALLIDLTNTGCRSAGFR